VADRSTLIQQLSQQLAQEETFLRQFRDVLQEEHELLSERELDKLEDVVKRKQSILDEFQQSVNERMQTLQELGLETTDSSDIRLIVEGCADNAPEIAESWENLQQLLDECKEQNTINGAIIEVSTNSLKVALSILSDRTANTELYDAKGNTRPGDGSGSSLAKA
jgi:flagella synthesis protein FlgN